MGCNLEILSRSSPQQFWISSLSSTIRAVKREVPATDIMIVVVVDESDSFLIGVITVTRFVGSWLE